MFTTPVAILTTPENHNEVTQGLQQLGYTEHRSVSYPNDKHDPKYPHVITNYDGKNVNGVYGNYRAGERYVARSIPEFLALAALTDEPTIKVGDYIFIQKGAGGWGVISENEECIGIVTDNRELIFGDILNPNRVGNLHKTGSKSAVTFNLSSRFVRKATKEELIALFSNNGDKSSPPKSNNMKRILSRADFKRIHAIACGDWKPKLAEKFKDLLLQDEVEVDETYYRLMRKACTTEQNALFDIIFGRDEVKRTIDNFEIVRNISFNNLLGTMTLPFCREFKYELMQNGEDQELLARHK